MGTMDFPIGAQAALQQRVAGIRGGGKWAWRPREAGFSAGKARRDAVEFLGEAGAGEERIDFCEDGGSGEDGRGDLGDLPGHLEEDAMNFGLLFFEQADEVVVELDGFEGFHVDGLAGGAGAVDDSLDAALELGFNRDDEALAADGDELVLRSCRLQRSGGVPCGDCLRWRAAGAPFRGGCGGARARRRR